MPDNTEKEWLDLKTIQEKYLPINRKAIRRFLKEKLDITALSFC